MLAMMEEEVPMSIPRILNKGQNLYERGHTILKAAPVLKLLGFMYLVPRFCFFIYTSLCHISVIRQ